MLQISLELRTFRKASVLHHWEKPSILDERNSNAKGGIECGSWKVKGPDVLERICPAECLHIYKIIYIVQQMMQENNRDRFERAFGVLKNAAYKSGMVKYAVDLKVDCKMFRV